MVLLLASLLLIVVLAWQAVDAARSHRAATAAMLQDLASLAGGEFIRRATASVGFNGYFPLINSLREVTPAQPGTLPDRDQLVKSIDTSLSASERRMEGLDARCLAGKLAYRLIRFAPGTHRLDSDIPLPAPLADQLEEVLTSTSERIGEGGKAYHVIHRVVEKEEH